MMRSYGQIVVQNLSEKNLIEENLFFFVGRL